MDSVKRALKSVLKRGKKNKQEQEHVASQQDHTAAADNIAMKPPQLPPVHNASPLQSPSTTETSRPLPPTHPLATGQHSQPQEAVPQNHDAQPGPLPAVDTADPTSAETPAVRHAGISPLDLKAGPNGATSDTKTAPPGDTSTVPPVDASKVEAASTPAPTPTPATNDTTKSNAPNAIPKQPTKTDSGIGEANHDVPSKVNGELQADATRFATGEKATIAHEEPPPIKAIQVAPGMSATSGPLEDFPEGGENLRDE